MKHSVVMAVYGKDRAEWLKQAIESLLNQTIPSDDIVIVADGPLTPQLNAALRHYEKEKSISLIRLKINQGLGNALNTGIMQTKNELIARMDADDVSILNRFELQLMEFNKNPKLEILGGQIGEFIDTPDEILTYRRVPLTHDEIIGFSHRRSPFNHPTVMYKKATIMKLGYYDVSAIRIEDYDLWLRALSNGAICANIDSVLINYRLTVDAIKRRKTFASYKSHIKARARFYGRKYISLPDFIYGLVVQTALLIIPNALASVLFNRLVRNAKA